MNCYRGTASEDILIAGMWHRMDADGDLATIFPTATQTMSELFRLVSPPKALLYEYDAQGIWIALWLEPLLGGCAAGFWIRSDQRRTRRAGWTFLLMLDTVTRQVPVIVGITKQRSLVRLHEKFGYTVVGEIPSLFDGDPAIVLQITRPAVLTAMTRLRHLNPEDPASPVAARLKAEERLGRVIIPVEATR